MVQRIWVKESACNCRRTEFNSWVRTEFWRKEWLLTPVLLPGEPHGQRSLVGYNPWGHKESDMTEWLHIQCPLGRLWIRTELHEGRQGTRPPLVGVRWWQKCRACSLKTWLQLPDLGGGSNVCLMPQQQRQGSFDVGNNPAALWPAVLQSSALWTTPWFTTEEKSLATGLCS